MFLKSNSKLYISQLAIHLSKNRRRSSAAKMLYASFRFSCQQLFSKFFQEALRPALPYLPRRLRGSGIASARCWFMPKSAGIVKHFFKVFPTFFDMVYNILDSLDILPAQLHIARLKRLIARISRPIRKNIPNCL